MKRNDKLQQSHDISVDDVNATIKSLIVLAEVQHKSSASFYTREDFYREIKRSLSNLQEPHEPSVL